MKQTQTTASAPKREVLPMRVEAKIHALHANGPILADASVDLNGCFAIRGVRVVSGSNGPFVSSSSQSPLNSVSACGENCVRSLAPPLPMRPAALGSHGAPNKAKDGYRDICFPCTKEFRQQFQQAVMDAYQQSLAQLPQRQQENSGQGMEAPHAPKMKM